jgi:AcrR family transcriptional regulator
MPRAPAKDRRQEILRQAAHLFLERGYEATSMNLIAERARVTKQGLYYHFKGKKELMFSIMSYALDLLEKHTREATAGPSDHEQRLRQIVENHSRMITREEDGAFTLLVIDQTEVLQPEDRRTITRRKRAHFELIRTTLEELRKEGKLRDVNTTVAAFSLLGMVMWISKWYRRDGLLGADEIAAQVTELALSAVLKDGRLPTTSRP